MFQFFKNLFGSSKNTETLLNGVKNGIDKAIYTKEEKAEMQKSLMLIQLEMLKARLNLSSITRRYLAWAIMGVYLIFVITGGILEFYNRELAQHLFSMLDKTYLGDAFLSVVFLYFGSYGLRQVVKK